MALVICTRLCAQGMCLHELPKKIQAAITEQAIALKNCYEREVFTILEKHKQLIERIAQQLEEKNTLTSQDLDRISGWHSARQEISRSAMQQ